MEAASKLRLWEISDELDEIGHLIAEAGGEIAPELEARLDAMAGAFEEKAENIALFIRECEANADAAKSEETRLAAIRKSFESKARGLKDYLLYAIRRTGRTSVRTPRVRVWEQKNGRPSLRFVGDVNSLPPDYKRIKVEPDLQFAFVEHQAGATLPAGFVVEHSTHLRVG